MEPVLFAVVPAEHLHTCLGCEGQERTSYLTIPPDSWGEFRIHEFGGAGLHYVALLCSSCADKVAAAINAALVEIRKPPTAAEIAGRAGLAEELTGPE